VNEWVLVLSCFDWIGQRFRTVPLNLC